jgi:glyoxylase-like metal-dependent hydrolase (beta-lactamase superfamily II)
MSTPAGSNPLLANLVRAGDQQQEAETITDFIFMAKDISNAYLVTTNAGDVMVNTGFMDNAERTKRLLAPKRTGPLRYIILTQAHADHYGGVPVVREPGTKVVTERRFVDTWQYFHDLGPYLGRRSAKLWSGTVKRGASPPPPPRIAPDIVVDRRYEFELGGRRFEVLSTPGGEALDSVVVWMPNERVVFTGNLFGPVFLAIPNLVTTRGDKPRLVQRYLPSLDTVRKLGAELLITGHGEPIRGADKIRASLDKMYAAVSYVNEQVIAGMNAGKDVYTLMREIALPEELKLGEFHGKVSWAVRAIWEEYSGWFHYDSTTSLYDVPRSNINADLVELIGGAGPLAARARVKLSEGRPLEALHLLDIALGVDRTHADALTVKKEALQTLLRDSGGTNLSEVMWLKSEIAAAESGLAASQTS